MEDPDKVFTQIIHNRKELSLTPSDIMVLMYLILLSRRRILIKATTSELGQALNMKIPVIHVILKKLKEKDYIKYVKSKTIRGFIVNPRLINNGSYKKKAFKIQLWSEW